MDELRKLTIKDTQKFHTDWKARHGRAALKQFDRDIFIAHTDGHPNVNRDVFEPEYFDEHPTFRESYEMHLDQLDVLNCIGGFCRCGEKAEENHFDIEEFGYLMGEISTQ